MILNFPRQPTCWAVLVGLWLNMAGAAAQELGQAPDKAMELEGLKKEYEKEIGKTVLPLREGYRKALWTLEQTLAGKGDYAGARQVQEERWAVEKQLGRANKSSVERKAMEEENGRLKLTSEGEGSGGVRQEGGAWTGWQTAGGAVRWALPPGMKGGGYTLELVYRSTGAGTLPVSLREDFHGLNRMVKVETAALAEARVRLGVLRVRPGAAGLELKLTGAGTAADFRLLAIQLIPEGGEP